MAVQEGALNYTPIERMKEVFRILSYYQPIGGEFSEDVFRQNWRLVKEAVENGQTCELDLNGLFKVRFNSDDGLIMKVNALNPAMNNPLQMLAGVLEEETEGVVFAVKLTPGDLNMLEVGIPME